MESLKKCFHSNLVTACFTVVLVACICSKVEACTVIAVGRNASVDGSTFMAHTDDAGGGAADIRLVRVPAQDHPEGSKRAVYDFFGGYPRVVTKERGPQYLPKDSSENIMEPLGFIPQVKHTYAYFDLDYGMMNEVQLSIAESTCGARTVGWPKDKPHGFNLFGIAELTKVALERCDSARCAVQTMGDLAVEYGFYSEDSGDPARPEYVDSAEALAIADKYGETWVFHVLTGPNNASAVWAAQKVPEGHVTAITNGFIIREMNLKDKENFLYSKNVKSFAEEMGWWNDRMGSLFDFTTAYGYHDTDAIRPLYVGRRIWRIFDVLAPSLKLDSTLGSFTQYPTYPFSIKPDKLVDLNTIMDLLRDHYEGTRYDMTKGIAAGPFGNPVRFDGPSQGVYGGWERAISMYRTMFSFVLQARSTLPDTIGGVAWFSQGSPHGSVYVPFSCGQEIVPESYLIGKQSEFNQKSAWWAFNFVNNWSTLRFNVINKEVRDVIAVFQKKAFEIRKKMEEQAHQMNSSKEINTFLQKQSNDFASSIVEQWWQLAWKLVGKYSDGYVTTGENPIEMKTLGYPQWWLQVSDFAAWPGDSFAPKDSIRHELVNYHPQNKTTIATIATKSVTSTAPLTCPPPQVVYVHKVSLFHNLVYTVFGVLLGSGFFMCMQWRKRFGYQPLQ